LKEAINRAVAAATAGEHRESIQLLERIAARAPVPAVFTNLGVEYARVNDVNGARTAFAKAIAKDPSYQPAHVNRDILEKSLNSAQEKPSVPITTPAISFEKSPVAAMLIDKLDGSGEALKEIHVVKGGTKVSGSYSIKYKLTPGTLTLVDTGTYDVLVRTIGGGTFVLARGLEVRDGQRARINPNVMLGRILVEPLTRAGFPAIKTLVVFEAGTKGSRVILQRTDKLGVPLPIVPGRYDIQGMTAESSDFVLKKDVQVQAQQIVHIQTDSEVAAFVVDDPKIGAQVTAIYVRPAGGKDAIAKAKGFGHPIMVPPDESYDIVIMQPGGAVTIATNVTAKRGEITKIAF